MENRNFYNQILTEHNLHPEHKHDLADANLVLEGVNPSCGDDIVLKLKVEDGGAVPIDDQRLHYRGGNGGAGRGSGAARCGPHARQSQMRCAGLAYYGRNV